MPSEDEKPKSKGQRRYSTPPKIQDKEPADGDTNKSGSEQGASAEAEKTAGKPMATNNASDPGPQPSEDAGTADIPVRHGKEREAMADRHIKELKQMHGRQADEMAGLSKMHEEELSKLGKAGA